MAISLARIYVLFSASCILSGWFLSLISSLTALGYGLALPTIFCGLIFLLPYQTQNQKKRFPLHLRHYRRPLPTLFAVIAALCFIGGLIHAPNNYDFLTYRLPRLLHWHEAHAWHWIETFNPRMNYSGPNAEWLLSPILIFTQSDRFFFLINWSAYLFLPSCIFTVFRRMGVRSQSAWRAMWLIPTAYCFVTQAASVGNDLLGVVFFLLAMAFAIQANQKSSTHLLAISALSMAICTGIKASNLPLILPWLLSILPCFKIFRHVSKKTLLIIVACSFAPMAALNFNQTGNWKGISPEDQNFETGSVSAGLLGNTLQAMVGALQPPIFPLPSAMNDQIESLTPASIKHFLATDFPKFNLRLVELPNEENAGLGLGILTVTVLGFLFAIYSRHHPKNNSRLGLNPFGSIIYGGMIFSTGTYMALMGSESTARLLSPYYPVLASLPFGVMGFTRIFNKKFWRVFFFILAGNAIILPITTPSRPLLPISSIADTLPLSEKLKKRIHLIYETYQRRSDILKEIREALPADATHIGLICSSDDTEVSLWKPFNGSRQVTHVTHPHQLKSIDVVVVHIQSIEESSNANKIFNFLNKDPHWSPSTTFHITSKVQAGLQRWVVYQKQNRF